MRGAARAPHTVILVEELLTNFGIQFSPLGVTRGTGSGVCIPEVGGIVLVV